MRFVIVALCLLINGCSIYSAVKAPDPIEYKKVVIGMPRSAVIDVFGRPLFTDTENEITVDNFKFIDGYHGAYKGRILLYLAGDLFTLGLAEVIFWPIEELLLQGAENKAIVEYNENSKAKKISVFSKKDGKVLYEKP